MKDDVTKDGIGAPLVAVRHLTAEQAAALFTAPAIYYGVTGFAEFEGSRCVLSIKDPLAAETVAVEGHTYPLAANFTGALAMMLAKEKPQKLGLVRLLRPEEYAATARVARLEPYNPNKSVVLVIHGLMDTPATWVPLLNDLRSDKDIRRNYQFWFYSYPSGYPYPYSALILRQELDAIEKRYPLRKPMVVVGHSMGGCITRTLITDTGNKLWIEAFGKPPEQTEMPAESKTPPRGGDHSQASTGNRARNFHVRSASRQRFGEQLDRAHRIDAGENAEQDAHHRQHHPRRR